MAVPNSMFAENAIKKEKKKSKYFYSLEIPVNIFCLLEEMVVLAVICACLEWDNLIRV